ncbi:uncharacterized protein LOC116181837 [Photinus pyralis]|uniref:uncharacterized protein LOC116181837 n=1 Tax=Photinus pyralis TaxID=7054 RepID=UPI001267245E|nr:uncharacterized protein LOC116181837 [Photinus pyralis]
MEVQHQQSLVPVTVLKTRIRRKRSTPATWNCNINKTKRSKGLPYQGKKKIGNTWNYQMNKPGKFLQNPCGCTLGKKKSTIQCDKLTEEERILIFRTFWNKLNWAERKMHVKTLVEVHGVKRRRGEQEILSKRNFSMKYFLKFDTKKVRVCKRMFGGTLGLKETMVLNWVKDVDNQNVNFESPEVNPKSEIRKIKFAEKNAGICEFLNMLPKLESHYCRASSKKQYLEPLWRSRAELYKFYKTEFCVEHNLAPASTTLFFNKFEELNLSLYKPKKDLCDSCEAFKTKNLSETDYTLHQTLKKDARQEKENDKTKTEATVNVYTMDLECVLLSPKSTVSSMYYKTKLIVHNFTIFNLKTKEGFCYLWNESEGGITANEFSSILSYFVEQEVKNKNPSEMIFYSDGCTGQNRNAILANAFLNAAIQNNIIITQKYLLKGHTQMEVDAMHSAIERQIRDRKINLPADYVGYCQKARSVPFPYSAKYIDYSFFKNFEGLKFYSSIRPGRTVGDPVVTDLKALRYLPNCEIMFKLRHTDTWNVLNQRLNKKIISCKFVDLPVLYNERRKIKKEKYDHLQALKSTILPDYHKFYDDLLYE